MIRARLGQLRLTWLDAVVAVLLAAILYASLSHGGGFVCDAKQTGGFLREAPRLSGGDFLGNLVAYLLLAAAMAIAHRHRHRRCLAPLRPEPASAPDSIRDPAFGRVFVVAVLACSILSLSMEAVQACLPGRVSSGWDWLANTLGAAIGWAGGAALSSAWKRLVLYGHEWIRERRLFELTLLAALAWAIAVSAPWVPSPDIGVFRHNTGNLWRAWNDGYIDPWRITEATAGWLALGWIVSLAVVRRSVGLAVFAAFAVVLPAMRLLVHDAGPSLEWVLGLAIASVAVVGTVAAAPRHLRAALGLIATTLAMLAYELEPGYGPPRAFSWQLHLLQGQPVQGLQLAAYFGWFGLAVVACGHAWSSHGRHDRRWAAVAVAIMAVLEAAQTQLPGRTPDLSPIVVSALAAWVALRMLRGEPTAGH